MDVVQLYVVRLLVNRSPSSNLLLHTVTIIACILTISQYIHQLIKPL